MADSPTTRPSLLLRIRDPQASDAWTQFADVYTPLIYRYMVRRGLQDADAADVTQEVLRAVAVNIGRFDYDRGRGSFRSWLYTVARNKLNDHLGKRGRQVVGSGETRVKDMLANQPDADADDQTQWDIDYRRQMFDWAVQQVRPHFQTSTWDAFWQTAVDSQSAKQVAEALGMSVGAVYIAKSRVLAKIKQCVEEVIGDESPEHQVLAEG